MSTTTTREFTPAQEKIINEMLTSIRSAPPGATGRRDWRATRRAIELAASHLTKSGINRFEAKRLADRFASAA